MSRSTRRPLISSVSQGQVALPNRNPPAVQAGLGAAAAHVPTAPETPGKRKFTALEAGDQSTLFGRPNAQGDRGGAAFAAWCALQGYAPDFRQTQTDWEPLLAEFGSQPIHGHRRKSFGGNHRFNPEDKR